MELSLRQASQNEIEEAFKMLKEAAEWIKHKDIDYWQDWHNPPENFKEWIREGFRNDQFYFVENNEEVIGMFRIQYEDELFWGKRIEKAGYIHSFTTNRRYKGVGIGYKILKIVEEKLKNEGIGLLRLDCSSRVSDLCRYYEKYGFKVVGNMELFGDLLSLYEKVL